MSCLITTEQAATRDGHLSKEYSFFFVKGLWKVWTQDFFFVFTLICFGLCFREVTLLVSFRDFEIPSRRFKEIVGGELVKITSSFGFKNN